MPTPVTVIILTKDEARNLPRCLASVQWADEVLVVDSFSADQTVDLARQSGARVIQHPFHNYAAQHNFAQAQARHDWVLFIDADECVSPELAAEIQRLAQTDRLADYRAYHIERLHLTSGRWLYSNPDRRRLTPRYRRHLMQVEVPRLYDRRDARWERPLHETLRAPEPHGVLAGAILHYANTNLSATLESFNAYTDREAAYLRHTLRRTRVSLLEAIVRGFRAFAFLYVWRGWWRLGEQGLLMAIINGCHRLMSYAKLGELLRIERGPGQWTEADRELLTRFDSDSHSDDSLIPDP